MRKIHPLQMANNSREDPVFVQGYGSYIKATSGVRYLDLLSGSYDCVLGYNHRVYQEALARQAQDLINTPKPAGSITLDFFLETFGRCLPHQQAAVTLLPSVDQCLELALRLARLATGRRLIMTPAGGNYGSTAALAALSTPGKNHYIAGGFLSDILGGGTILPVPVDIPNESADPFALWTPGRLSEALARFAQNKGENGWDGVAAILFEPIQVAGGLRYPPPGTWELIAATARRHGALIIVDEAITGIGRLGAWLGGSLFGLEGDLAPDMIIFGKALGNGYPLGALTVTAEVEKLGGSALHMVQSHQNAPLGAAVATAVLQIIEAENLLSRVSELEYFCRNLFAEIALKTSLPLLVRGRGLLLGITIDPRVQRAKDSKRELLFAGVQKRLAEKAIICGYEPRTDTLFIAPPYVITTGALEWFAVELTEALFDSKNI